jgi:alpha-D-glucose phosphate-specific phosphoglucomutase
MGIEFGTDGWRAVIGDELTFANVRRVAQAVGDVLRQRCPGHAPAVAIGYDTCFLSDRFAAEAANVLAANGMDVALSRSDCPTPVLSYAVAARGADAGVMITVSHNPPRYSGFKLKAADGASALPDVTRAVESRLAENTVRQRAPRLIAWRMEDRDLPASALHGAIERFDALPPYLAHLRTLIDLPALKAARLRVVSDPMHGAGRGYLARILSEAGCEVREIRGELNPGFGGVYPEPIARHLQALVGAVTGGGYDLGLATDGDADRIGAVDACGAFVDPHRMFALALQYLVEVRGWRGSVVKTVSTTQHIDRLCRRYGLTLHETPVGFDHISDWAREPVLIGGEESGGITIRGHIPQGDGLMMGLLLAEIVAVRGKPLHELVEGLMRDLGPVCYGRDDRQTRPFNKRELLERRLARTPERIAGALVSRVDATDGVKYRLGDDGWLLIRPSDTEPLLRVYAEARGRRQLDDLLQAGAVLAEQGAAAGGC